MGGTVKLKTCRVCKSKFAPARQMQAVCGLECARGHAAMSRAKKTAREAAKRKRETRKRLEEMKSVPDLMKEADAAFMAFIRERDRLAGYPCISSGKPLDWSGNNVDAGHYRSRGAASALRYDQRNCHAQSKHENRYKGGNIVEYRKGLIERIGIEAVEALENDNRTHKWTRDELRGLRDTYRAKLKELRK